MREVQRRNMAALRRILNEYEGKIVVIGTHGMALSAVLHGIDPSFGYEAFEMMRNKMPWIVETTWEAGHGEWREV